MEEHKYVYEFNEDPKKLLHTQKIDNFATKITVDGFVIKNRYGSTDFDTPKFKKGDKIVINISKSNYIKEFIDIYDKKIGIVTFVTSVGVGVDFLDKTYSNFFMFDEVSLLSSNCSFKPFDKVLCRDCDSDEWQCDLFSHIQDDAEYPYVTIGHMWGQCIPYEGNEYLLGTTKKS